MRLSQWKQHHIEVSLSGRTKHMPLPSLFVCSSAHSLVYQSIIYVSALNPTSLAHSYCESWTSCATTRRACLPVCRLPATPPSMITTTLMRSLCSSSCSVSKATGTCWFSQTTASHQASAVATTSVKHSDIAPQWGNASLDRPSLFFIHHPCRPPSLIYRMNVQTPFAAALQDEGEPTAFHAPAVISRAELVLLLTRTVEEKNVTRGSKEATLM